MLSFKAKIYKYIMHFAPQRDHETAETSLSL